MPDPEVPMTSRDDAYWRVYSALVSIAGRAPEANGTGALLRIHGFCDRLARYAVAQYYDAPEE